MEKRKNIAECRFESVIWSKGVEKSKRVVPVDDFVVVLTLIWPAVMRTILSFWWHFRY
jgi:hypothetical protein